MYLSVCLRLNSFQIHKAGKFSRQNKGAPHSQTSEVHQSATQEVHSNTHNFL